jgi:tRNA modification GTPase
MEALADADLVLVVLDASEPRTREDDELLAQAEQRAAIVVENKSDLEARGQGPGVRGQYLVMRTSALNGEGIAELRDEILRHVSGGAGNAGEAGFLTNVRQAGLIQESLGALGAAQGAVANRVPHEMLLLDLYNALRPLDSITGATTTDDILNLIFSTFCIGK